LPWKDADNTRKEISWEKNNLQMYTQKGMFIVYIWFTVWYNTISDYVNHVYRKKWKKKKLNKIAKMVLNRSPDPSNSSEQLLRQASWPSLMTIEIKMWPLECSQGFSLFGQSVVVIGPRWPRNHQNKLADQFPLR
jgi:hypothetical protein